MDLLPLAVLGVYELFDEATYSHRADLQPQRFGLRYIEREHRLPGQAGMLHQFDHPQGIGDTSGEVGLPRRVIERYCQRRDTIDTALTSCA